MGDEDTSADAPTHHRARVRAKRLKTTEGKESGRTTKGRRTPTGPRAAPTRGTRRQSTPTTWSRSRTARTCRRPERLDFGLRINEGGQ